MNDSPVKPWFVTGFVDGEGIFTYNRNGARLLVVFAIRLAATDRPLLERIREFFGGIGRMYSTPPRAPTKYGGHSKASCYFKVTRPVELVRVVKHFDRYRLQGEKRHVYEVWREMVFLRAAYHGSAPPGEIYELADELSRRVPRNKPWKPSGANN